MVGVTGSAEECHSWASLWCAGASLRNLPGGNLFAFRKEILLNEKERWWGAVTSGGTIYTYRKEEQPGNISNAGQSRPRSQAKGPLLPSLFWASTQGSYRYPRTQTEQHSAVLTTHCAPHLPGSTRSLGCIWAGPPGAAEGHGTAHLHLSSSSTTEE